MNLFRFLPRAVIRLKLGVFLCAVLMGSSLVGLAQDNSGNTGGNPPINNPKGHDVSRGNYVPPTPPSGPDVYYNHRWDLYSGLAYTNFLAGPALIQRSNMGGFDAAGTYWLSWHWGIRGDARMYVGTSGVFPNTNGGSRNPICPISGTGPGFDNSCYGPSTITGPRIMQYYFMMGPQYRIIRRAKASGTFHALFGNAYGVFDSAHLPNLNVQTIGLFATQWTFGSAFGGTFDYNYTPRIAFRIEPDMLMTHYGGTMEQNFAFSVGPVFRLGKLNTSPSANKAHTEKHSMHLHNPFHK